MLQLKQTSKKRKFINEGVFFAEINEFLRRMLAEDGYAGVEIKPKPDCTQIVIRCTKTPEVVKRIPYIQKLIQLRHGIANEDMIKVYADKVNPRGLSARAQAQSICYKLKGGLAVRRACYGVLKFIMDNGKAKGVEIIISGKLRGARAKAMKFKEGYMICSGHATTYYIVEAVEHVLLRQGTIGVRVKIMLPYNENPEGRDNNGGVTRPLPDVVKVIEPKPDYDDDPVIDQQAPQYGGGYGQGPPQQEFQQQETQGFGAPQQQPPYQQPEPPQQQQVGYQEQPATRYEPQTYAQPPPQQQQGGYYPTPGGPPHQV